MTAMLAGCAPERPTTFADESDLVVRLRAGDNTAYDTLVRTHAGALSAVARRYLGDTADAAEAVQDAFVSAFRAIGRFGGTSRLGTWLHRIAVNCCLMKLRSRKRRRCVSLSEVDAPVGRPVAPDLERAESRDRLLAGIDALPESFRTIIRLRDLDGLDTAETAARLGTNESVVKTRLHRARHALRAVLEADLDSLVA